SLNEHDGMDEHDNMNEHNSMNEHDSGRDEYRNYEPEENITEDVNDDYEIQKVFNSWDVAMEEIEKYTHRKAATNRYEMALSIFLIVDNHLHSHMVVQALIDDEMMEYHSWIFQNIKNATRNAVPRVIFTDADLAVSAAICDEFPTTKSLHCMFHISQNLFSNLKSCLGDQYNEFIQNFYEMQKSP
ncbi:7631_t:CDS:2, partial [Dentiscutata erythropus]